MAKIGNRIFSPEFKAKWERTDGAGFAALEAAKLPLRIDSEEGGGGGQDQ